MAALESEVVEPQELPAIDEYEFLGDNWTVTRKRAFIVNYREEGSVYHAAARTRVSRQCVYNWIQADEQFALAVEESKEDCYDKAESSVFKKALAGDSLLLMFYLKAHRHKFRDKVTIDLDSVRDEIQQRLGQLNVAQLNATNTTQFPPQPEQIQKELQSSSLGPVDHD